MDFEDNQSSSSSSPPHNHKKRAGRKIFKETRHPIYRGVRQKNGGKWVCEVREPNKKTRIWLGTFPNPETAAVAHDVAALALRGDNAPLNFPDSAASLPRPQSSSQKDIQRAAFQAARDFRLVSGSSGQTRVSDVELVTCNHGPGDCESGNNALEGYVDEEEVFNMPVLLDSMAEGMLLTPLAMKKGFNWSDHEDDDGIEIMALWGN
ncbi:hypothetical protein CDL12_01834 [Handroanthus impetiginosus]|uniref:AP2/ERF domain-containing protein n=1 Tax=Handroanthus impetiginosus TaxID=429701 RepID=A0A2G9I6L3_9LAMI|nr:hypothetical protein CDL12_01834 [Handroanthus impetiginosus]